MSGSGRAELTRDGAVATIRFSGGPGGCMDEAMEAALLESVKAAEEDGALRACILAGAEPGVFIRHYDVATLHARAAAMRARGMAFSEARPVRESPIHEAMRRMEEGRVVWLAALNGTAMGGGFELALACDFRIVAPGPHRFGLPEINLGLLPGAGGTIRLPRLAGEAKALEMTLLGRTLSPEELAAAGLAILAGDAEEEARNLARRLAGKPPRALAHIKRLVRGLPDDRPGAERALFCDLMVSDDASRLMGEWAEGRRTIEDEPA